MLEWQPNIKIYLAIKASKIVPTVLEAIEKASGQKANEDV